MPGAAGHVLSTSLGRNWQSSDMPVGVNPKTQEAVYRAVGRGGVVDRRRGRPRAPDPPRQRRALEGAARRVRRAGHRDLRRPRRGRGADREARVRRSRRCRRRSTAPRWPRSSSASSRCRSRWRRCRSRRASTRRRHALRARAEPARGRASGADQDGSGRLVVQAALVGVPDHRGDHEDQQHRAHDGRHSPAHAAVETRCTRMPRRRWPGLPPIVGMKTICTTAKIDEGRQRVVVEERDRDEHGAAPSRSTSAADPPAELRDAAACPLAGSPSRSPG